MAENSEKDKTKPEEPEKKELENEEKNSKGEEKDSKSDTKKSVEETENKENEKYTWVDEKGRKPYQYLLPIYTGIGVLLLFIWILIIFFAIKPAWEDYQKEDEPGLEIEMSPEAGQTQKND